MIRQRGATVTCANDRLIRLKKSSHKLASIYVIGFVINLYLMLLISIWTFDVTWILWATKEPNTPYVIYNILPKGTDQSVTVFR